METTVVATADDDEVGDDPPLPRPTCGGRRRHPAGQPRQAAHAFHGPVESGLAKMAVVGFGKRPGAAEFHATGPSRMNARLATSIAALRATGRLLGGVATVEAADGGSRRTSRRSRPTRSAVQWRRGSSRPPGPPAGVCPSTTSTCSSSSRVARTSPARPSIPTSPAGSGSTAWPIFDDHGSRRSSSSRSRRPRPGARWASASPTSSRRRWPPRSTGSRPTSTASPQGHRASGEVACRWCFPTSRHACAPLWRRAVGGADEPKRVVRIRSTLHLTRCWVSEALLDELPPGARRVVVRRTRAPP